MPKRVVRLAPIFLLLVVAACASSSNGKPKPATLTPLRWIESGTWRFQIADPDGKQAGSILLNLSAEPVGDELCVDKNWKKAIILNNGLEVDIGDDAQPAYLVHGRWLTVDLTADRCNVGHKFVGELSASGASGFFNYTTSVGGRNLGSFVAEPLIHYSTD